MPTPERPEVAAKQTRQLCKILQDRDRIVDIPKLKSSKTRDTCMKNTLNNDLTYLEWLLKLT